MKLAPLTLSILALVAAASVAQAGSAPATAPIFVNAGDDYGCTIANTGTKDVASVEVKVIVNGNSLGASNTCAPLAAGSVCSVAAVSVPSSNNRWCTVTTLGSPKALRGRFCNQSTAECESMR